MYCVMHLTLVAGILKCWASPCAMYDVAWVDHQVVRLPSLSHSATQPCDSRQWWQITGTPYSPSTTASAFLNPSSMLPLLSSLGPTMLFGAAPPPRTVFLFFSLRASLSLTKKSSGSSSI